MSALVPAQRFNPFGNPFESVGERFGSLSIFGCTNRSAPKKSTWVRRKTEELNECYEQGESDPQKIDECDNFADPQIKYLVGKVWARHLHYTHNLEGEPPLVAAKLSKKAKLDNE